MHGLPNAARLVQMEGGGILVPGIILPVAECGHIHCQAQRLIPRFFCFCSVTEGEQNAAGLWKVRILST